MGVAMHTDEEGNKCPKTLGEYRDLCAVLGGEDCAAVCKIYLGEGHLVGRLLWEQDFVWVRVPPPRLDSYMSIT